MSYVSHRWLDENWVYYRACHVIILSIACDRGRFSDTQARAAETGMKTLLQLHNTDEVSARKQCSTKILHFTCLMLPKYVQLRELCDELGIPDRGLSNEEIIARIFEMVRHKR